MRQVPLPVKLPHRGPKVRPVPRETTVSRTHLSKPRHLEYEALRFHEEGYLVDLTGRPSAEGLAPRGTPTRAVGQPGGKRRRAPYRADHTPQHQLNRHHDQPKSPCSRLQCLRNPSRTAGCASRETATLTRDRHQSSAVGGQLRTEPDAVRNRYVTRLPTVAGYESDVGAVPIARYQRLLHTAISHRPISYRNEHMG